MIVQNELNTIKKLQQGYSISRYGDGEFRIINGAGILYQEYNKELQEKLKNILMQKEIPEKLLIAIPPFYSKNSNGVYICQKRIINKKVVDYWRKYIKKSESILCESLFNDKKIYYSSFISRIESFENKRRILGELSKIWLNKNVAIIINEIFYKKTEKLIKNSLKKSIIKDIIYCPQVNAYNEYNNILQKCLQHNKDVIFLIMAGPTASILTYDLCKNDYQAIDIGHFFELYNF